MSDNPEYESLKAIFENSDNFARVAEIDHYVIGQDFDSIRARVDQLIGTYLFVEFGDGNASVDSKGSINDTITVAITIASKYRANTDLIEISLISNKTLNLLNKIRGLMIKDKDPWLSYFKGNHDLSPFVSKEFSSVGWSMKCSIFIFG